MDPRTDVLVDGRWAAAPSPISHLILPDGSVDLVERGGELVVMGPMARARWVRVSGAPARGVRLHPGAASWLGVPLGELRDLVVPWSDLPVRAPSGADLLATAVGHGRRHLRRDPRVLRVARSLMARPDQSVGALAQAVGWTPRHLRRRFDAEVGLTPRLFGRIMRLQRLTSDLAGTEPIGDLAHRHGFFDQAHLSRDVKALTGLSPLALRRVLAPEVRSVQGQPTGAP